MWNRADPKSAWRMRMRQVRDAFQPGFRASWSRDIAERVTALPELAAANTVGVYLAMGSEVSLDGLIETLLLEGKKVYAPRVLEDRRTIVFCQLRDVSDVEIGYYGIREPRGEVVEALDLLLIPGLAFTLCGIRLGYGGGFYDRYLANTSRQAVKVGVAFDGQIVQELPTELHDIRMDHLVTDRRTYHCKG
ncbi:5-formyltetrahydrofolate cyclo-ligase [Ferroacidibacillus organovorans]|uniref:5-formyltetrahydrofolate cyclo-ligase n=1 Tax=Ferroacidibacillus organovorans TaxID=1765683 RepID=A0A101XR55_9BACL|nr:5-formyltetrahydrofolate cyclo-ligase [Ferroacidibacillus organovorans]KUO96000.1 hypothetical protein ATW55_02680 [Ferroacidibacillus organovorans]